jgi:hypothetical protein
VDRLQTMRDRGAFKTKPVLRSPKVGEATVASTGPN